MSLSFEKRLANQYDGLSDALRNAAQFLASNPLEIATRPLRTASRESGVSPAAFTRLAQALKYTDFEELREEMRGKIERNYRSLANKAERLQQDHGEAQTSFLDAHLDACQQNLNSFGRGIDRNLLDATVDRLVQAKQVVLLGALGSTGAVEYLSYMANLCAPNWSMAGRMGASLGSALTGLSSDDVLLVVTKPPFAERSIAAARLAHDLGVYVIVITDTHTCPALRFASAGFVVPTASPHFFSSYVTTMFFVETMIGLVLSRSGEKARVRIARVAQTNVQLAEVYDQ